MSLTTRTEIQVKHHSNTSSSNGWSAIYTALLILMAGYFMLPIIWLFISTTKSETQLFSTSIFSFPAKLHLIQNILAVSEYKGGLYWIWFANSVGYSLLIASLGTLFSAAAGYVLAKYSFKGKEAVFWLVLILLMIPGAVSAIPTFILERSMGLLNTYAGVILPQLVNPFGVYFMRIYIAETMPSELLEASTIDGASHLRTFGSIVLPIIRPGLLTLFLIAFIGSWNNFFLPLLVLSNAHQFPLTLGLYSWLGLISQHVAGVSWDSMLITGAAISIIPMLILFPFLSKYIASGLARGSLKL